MKKIISGIMAMALALLLVIQPNSVVKAESVSLSVSASTVNVGDTVSVTVSCPSGYGVDVIISVDNTSVLAGGNDTIVVIGDAAGQSNSSAPISFSAVGAGTCTISASVRTAGDSNGDPVEFGGASATITVNNAVTEPPADNGGTDAGTGDTGTTTTPTTPTLSSDNTLKSLVLSNGTLSPAFSSKTKNYTATVDNSVTSLAITATPTNAAAKVTSVSGKDNLEVGENTITITVKAENGVTTTYTIVVTRRSETDPENTDIPEEQKIYEVSGNRWKLSTEILEEEIPQDFTMTTILIDNLEYPCLSFDKGGLDLIKMTSEDGLNTGLFVYDQQQGAIYSFAKISGEEHYVIILMPDVSEVPSGYAEVTLSIEGKADVVAYQKIEGESQTQTDSDATNTESVEQENVDPEAPENADGVSVGLFDLFAPEVIYGAELVQDDFYLIYCMNDRGEKGWYQYDNVEGTFIRYVAPIATVEQVEQVQTTDSAMEAELANLKMERTIILCACGVIFILLLIIIIALAIRIANAKKDFMKELEENDQDDIYHENEKSTEEEEYINFKEEVENKSDIKVNDIGTDKVEEIEKINEENDKEVEKDKEVDKDIILNLENALEQEVSVERLESVKKEEKTVQDEEDDSKKKPRKKWGKKKENLEEDEEDITFIDL